MQRPKSENGEVNKGVRDVQQAEKQPELDPELQAHIGRHLKASYDDILSQDVPDRFVDLLKMLEAKEGSGSGTKGGAQ